MSQHTRQIDYPAISLVYERRAGYQGNPEIEGEKGSVSRPKKMGVLRQDHFEFDAYRVLDSVIMGNTPLWAALQERLKKANIATN